VVPQIYPLLIAGKDVNVILKSIRPTDKIDKDDVLNALSDLQGFSLNAGKNNLPTIVLKSDAISEHLTPERTI